MRLVLYTGKGGVGKTTTAAATAAVAAERGVRTLVASADSAHSLGDVFEQRLGPDPTELAPRLAAVELDARVEMTRHWGTIQEFLLQLFRHQGIEEVVAEELALLPGAEELATLLAVEDLAERASADLVILDCAPTDSTLRLATLPDVVHGALRVLLPLIRAVAGAITPIAQTLVSMPLPGADVFRDVDELVYRRLSQLQERITSETTTARIVVTPERMVIDEGCRIYTELSLFEVGCDAVVMNRLLPSAATEEAFFRDRARTDAERCREVEERFAPLPQLRAPLQEDEVTGVERLAAHGRDLFGERAPEAVLCPPSRVRFEREEGGYAAHVPLPGADVSDLDVAKVDGDLVITTGGRRRAIRLPSRLSELDIERAQLEADSLVVHLGAAPGAD